MKSNVVRIETERQRMAQGRNAYPEIEKVYPSLPSMLEKYDKWARRDVFRGHSREEFLAWQDRSRETLRTLLGLEKMEQCEGWTRQSGVEKLPDGIVREKLLLETEPDVWCPMYILYPAGGGPEVGMDREDAAQIYLCPPGHGGAGKYSIAGLGEYTAVEASIDKYNYDIGLQIARAGAIAVCPDIRGFGERREELADTRNEDTRMRGDCYWLAHMGEPLGIPVLGMLTWDLMRIVDYLTERFFGRKISVVGFSGGAMQGLYLAALDERVDSVLLSGYMYGFRDSLLKMNRNCSCNYVPKLWEHFDMGDIGSLIAPRTILIQSGREDRLNGERGVINAEEQVDTIRAGYRLLGAEDRLRHEIHDGGHRFYSEALLDSLRFLQNN